MIRLLSIVSVLFFIGCTQSGERGIASESHDHPKASHQEHYPHFHKHKKDCGHKMEKVGKKKVYIHDGHKHVAHGDHFDDL